MKIDIDLATHNYRTVKKTVWSLSGFIVLLIGIGIALGLQYIKNIEHLNELKIVFEERSSQTASPMNESALIQLKRKVSAANDILLRRSFSVIHLLNELEKTIPWKTTLTRLEISEDGSEILISGTTNRSSSLLKFIQALRDQPGFTHVFLAKQEETSIQGIAFEIRCTYEQEAPSA